MTEEEAAGMKVTKQTDDGDAIPPLESKTVRIMPQVIMGILTAILSMLLFALLSTNKNEARSERASQNGVITNGEFGCKFFHDSRSNKCFAFCYAQSGYDRMGGANWMPEPCDDSVLSVAKEMQ